MLLADRYDDRTHDGGEMLVGFVLFAVAKTSVVAQQRWITFGTRTMSENMANVYRIGYWLMAVGILATFSGDPFPGDGVTLGD